MMLFTILNCDDYLNDARSWGTTVFGGFINDRCFGFVKMGSLAHELLNEQTNITQMVKYELTLEYILKVCVYYYPWLLVPNANLCTIFNAPLSLLTMYEGSWAWSYQTILPLKFNTRINFHHPIEFGISFILDITNCCIIQLLYSCMIWFKTLA